MTALIKWADPDLKDCDRVSLMSDPKISILNVIMSAMPLIRKRTGLRVSLTKASSTSVFDRAVIFSKMPYTIFSTGLVNKKIAKNIAALV
jgi:hypothetical protein